MFTNLACPMEHLCLSSHSASKPVINSFEEDMAPKNVIIQSSKKENIGSTSKGSAKASIASGSRSTRVMTRSMIKVAAFVTLKEQVVAPTLKSSKAQKFGSNLPSNGVNQAACLLNLKLKPLTTFNIRKTLVHGINEFQIYINPAFQPFRA